MVLTKRILLGLFILAALTAPSLSYAIDLRTGSEISISNPEELSEENIYVVGGTSDFSTTIPGDLSILSGENTFSGIVEQDFIAGSGLNILEGEIKGDARIVGGDVIIKGIVHGQTIVIGADVRIEEGADLRGDVLIAGGKVEVNAPVSSFLKIVGGHVTINDKISGTTEVTTQQLIFTDDAEVTGSFLYFSPTNARESEGTVLSGEIHFNQISSITDSNVFKRVVLNFINFWVLLQFVTTLLLAFLLVYVFRVFSQKVTDYALHSFWKSLLFGILAILFIPLLSSVLFVSLIALPISILLMLTLAFMFVLSYAVAGIIVGVLIHRMVKKEGEPTVSFQSATIGVILLTVLQFVPVVGDLTRLIFFIVSIGTMTHYIYSQVRFNKA